MKSTEVKNKLQELLMLSVISITRSSCQTKTVYCISSRALALVEVEHDILRAESVGRKCKKDFIANRLEIDENFFDPIK